MSKTSATGNIVPKVIYDIRFTQHRMKSDQDSLLATAKSLPETHPDFTFDNLDSMMRSTIANDLLATNAFNILVKQHDQTICPIPYGIRFNKMPDILSGVNEITSGENVAAILGGRLPCRYDNTLGDMLPTLGEKGTYWGTSAPTFSTAFIQEAISTVTGDGLGDTGQSSIFHRFMLPASFDCTNVIENIYISVDASGAYLTVPHSGYSFGGDRHSTKPYKPQDCSSLFETQYDLPEATASTADLYCTWQYLTSVNYSIPESWLASPSGALVKLFDVAETPQAGDALILRKFSEARPMATTLGIGGHAGIVLGVDKEDRVITIAYNRSMPDMEGFGMETHTPDADENKFYFYLRPNNTTLAKVDSSVVPKYPEYTGLSDLAGLVSYVDSNIAEEDIFLAGDTYGDECKE